MSFIFNILIKFAMSESIQKNVNTIQLQRALKTKYNLLSNKSTKNRLDFIAIMT